jgi:hypothetical protein
MRATRGGSGSVESWAGPRRCPAGLTALVWAAACAGTAPVEEGGAIAGSGGASAGSESGGGDGEDGGSSSGGTSEDGGSSSRGTSASPSAGMQVLHEGEDDPSLIALDDRFIYWATREALRQAPLDGGPPVSLVSLASIRAIVPSGDHVYFTQSSFGAGQVARVPRAGGEAQRIASGTSPSQLAVADGFVYWSDPGTSIDTGQIFRAALDGSEVTPLAQGLASPSDVAIDADHVYFSSSGQSCGVSSEGSSCIGGGIHRLPKSGGASEQVVPGDIVSSFWLHAGELYWFASSPPRLMVAPPLGAEREIVNVLAEGTGALTSDGEALYWGSEDKVVRVPFGSGAVTRLATNLENPSGVAVRGDSVYVAESASGRILRVATDGSANRPSGPITGPCPEPIGTLEELEQTPRADPNLEQLALELEPGNLTASQATYERVVADIAAIRALVPDRADIGYLAPHDGKTLYLGLTELVAQSILAGEYSAWDCLNERYGASEGEPNETFGNWSLLLALRGIYDVSRLAERYAELPGVTTAEANLRIGDGSTLCAARDGARYQYVVDRAGGDCPAGCTEHDARAFASEAAGQITALGAWDSTGGDPAPAWFAICR